MTDRESSRTTPAEVEINNRPREPVTDPTLGIEVPARRESEPGHRLVTIGDSLTQGFMSAAIHRTDISWPALVAYELGLTANQFRFPTYEWPTGPGGLPLDLERLTRAFEQRFGPKLDFWEIVSAGLWVRSYMDDVEDYWERGPGSVTPPTGEPFHNMAVYGWDVLDAVLLDARIVSQRIKDARDDPLKQMVSDDGSRAALTVLQRARTGRGPRSVLDCAAAMARANGLETLVVMLGANNALGSVVSLSPSWTPEGYAEQDPAKRLASKGPSNVWRPSHFAADWALLVEKLRQVDAWHVIVATVPSVTIAPIARGLGGKVSPESRYFPQYSRPWIREEDFDAGRDPHITADEARAIDSAIDAYNETIIDSVRAARADGLDWYVFDLGGVLDRLATRRYINSPWARPAWWTPYELPAQLLALDPVPNTRFFRAGPQGRADGGVFSLDGVHPTTSGYGLVAQEVIRVMERAGVAFANRDGTPRTQPVDLGWDRILAADTLMTKPPAGIGPTLSLLGWLDERLDWVGKVLPFSRGPSLGD